MNAALLSVLLSWAITLSHYPAPASAPVVRAVAHSEIVDLMCDGVQCDVKAAYNPVTKEVLIDESLDPDATFVDSIVIHEMVHALQPAGMGCREKEAEAWGVQTAFLVAYGDYLPVKQHFEGVCT